jgi:hypothetical protein
MELAGLDTDDYGSSRTKRRPSKAPDVIERVSADEAEFEDVMPEQTKHEPSRHVETSDDDFLKFIEEDVTEKNAKAKRKK